jgi:integrase
MFNVQCSFHLHPRQSTSICGSITLLLHSKIKNQQSSFINPAMGRTIVLLEAQFQRCRVIHEKDREAGLAGVYLPGA